MKPTHDTASQCVHLRPHAHWRPGATVRNALLVTMLLSVPLAIVACGNQSPAAPSVIAAVTPAARAAVSDQVALPGMAARGAGASSTWAPLSWVLSAASCPLLTSDVTGSGDSHLKVRTTDSGDGTLNVSLTNNVHGRAGDSDGNDYVFNYTATVRGTATAIPPAPPLDLYVTDHFNLVGAGKTLRVQVGFLIHVVIDADGNFTAFDIKQRGPAGCDPI